MATLLNKQIRTWASLLTLLVLPFVFTLFPALAPYTVIISLIALILIALWALLEGAWVDVAIAGGMALFLFVAPTMYTLYAQAPLQLLSRVAAGAAWALLSTAFIAAPLSHIWSPAGVLVRHRRHIGVAAFLSVVMHATINTAVAYEWHLLSAWGVPYIAYGAVAFFLLTLLGLTSWNVIQYKLKPYHWYLIHGVGLAVFIGFCVLLATLQPFISPLFITAMVATVVYWVVSAPWGLPQKLSRYVNGWKQLQRLIYPIYILVALHMWFASVNAASTFVQWLFFMSIALLVLVEVFARIHKLLQRGLA